MSNATDRRETVTPSRPKTAANTGSWLSVPWVIPSAASRGSNSEMAIPSRKLLATINATSVGQRHPNRPQRSLSSRLMRYPINVRSLGSASSTATLGGRFASNSRHTCRSRQLPGHAETARPVPLPRWQFQTISCPALARRAACRLSLLRKMTISSIRSRRSSSIAKQLIPFWKPSPAISGKKRAASTEPNAGISKNLRTG